MEKKIERLMTIDFESETTYSDNEYEYIKTKIKTQKKILQTQIFIIKQGLKKYQEKKYHMNV